MKNGIVFILFALLTINSNAQELKFGTTAGVNYSKVSETNAKLGYQVGIVGNYLFSSKANTFFIENGLTLVSRRWESNERRVNVGDYDVMKKDESSPYYLNMPVLVGYQFCLGSKVKAQVSIGPYLEYGLFGKNSEITYKDGELIRSAKYNVFATPLKRFDWGMAAKVSLLYKEKYQLSVELDKGLSEVYGERKWNSVNLGMSLFL